MNYTSVALKARNAIAKNGAVCTIKRRGEEKYNPETDEYEGEETEIAGYAVEDYFSEHAINGTSIQYGDVKLMATFDGIPKQGDVLQFSGKELVVVDIPKAISPDGTVICYYELHCR